MDKKYTPHIRIPFSLFNSAEFKQIPDTYKSNCLSLLMCLLKFVNNRTGKCYPRQSTISSMIGLSRTTIYRATLELKKAKIIQIKRLSSTLLYKIEPKFIYGYVSNLNNDVSKLNNDVSNLKILIKHNTISNTTYITNIVREVLSNKAATKDDIINKLATLPTARLEQAIKEKDNILYCKAALEVQSKKGQKLVDLPSKLILENIRKKTNFAYQRAIEKRKREDGRQNRSKDLLRGNLKAKR